MQLGINTDYLHSTGSPEKYLRLAAEAGFTHIHWCHQWNTDFLYSSHEIGQIGQWLKTYGLQLQDIHASAGMEKAWYGLDEYIRRSGVELIINRIEMFDRLGGTGGLALHTPCIRRVYKVDNSKFPQYMQSVRRSLDELMPVLEKYHTFLAIENMANDFFEAIEQITAAYPADQIGITYDSGHGNYGYARGLEHLEKNKDRLKVLHLNDNNGTIDSHQLPFYGTVDWEKLTGIIARSTYTGPLSFEVAMRYMPEFFNPGLKEQPDEMIREFLAEAYRKCSEVVRIYDRAADKHS